PRAARRRATCAASRRASPPRDDEAVNGRPPALLRPMVALLRGDAALRTTAAPPAARGSGGARSARGRARAGPELRHWPWARAAGRGGRTRDRPGRFGAHAGAGARGGPARALAVGGRDPAALPRGVVRRAALHQRVPSLSRAAARAGRDAPC